MSQKWIVGIDEAGRGPLAGPVAVGVVMVSADFDWAMVPGVGDSKQMKPEKREALFRLAWQLRKAGKLRWSVAMSAAAVIDERGIVWAVETALRRGLLALDATPRDTHVLLDGGLKAPSHFLHQTTIIKGDAKEPAIGLASILAKVTRDRYMVRIAPQFAPHDFAAHKGYGTRAHRAAIAKHGLSTEHRRSFCTKLLS